MIYKFTDDGEASQQDIQELNETLQILREKRDLLLKQKESLIENYQNINTSVVSETEKNDMLLKKLQKKNEKVSLLPSSNEVKFANELKLELEKKQQKLEELKKWISEKKEEKNQKMDALYSPSSNKTAQTAINYIHQSLINELSSLVNSNAPIAAIQEKEKQVQICEDFLNI